MSKEVIAVTNSVIRKQSLRAQVIRACQHCGAPGFWHNTPGVNVGCYAPDKVTLLGQDWVGPICPQCGADSVGVEDHGEIWSREWRASPWRAFVQACFGIFKRRTKR